MTLESLTRQLDNEFAVPSSKEDLVQWAVTDENRSLVNSQFIEHNTGLMVKGSETIHSVRTSVFVTDKIVKKLCGDSPCLLFTHHNFDYYEDERGLQPIRREQIDDLVQHGHSVYVAHAPLDIHPHFGTSLALASAVGIAVTERFYDYFGGPTALVGDAGEWELQAFAEHVRKNLARPRVAVKECDPRVHRVAVVAGSGDLPDLLQDVHDRGCDTMLMGTLEHRWAIPAIQEAHQQFLRLNDKLRINVIGGSHFGTERPAMMQVVQLFTTMGIPCEYCEDEGLLNAV